MEAGTYRQAATVAFVPEGQSRMQTIKVEKSWSDADPTRRYHISDLSQAAPFHADTYWNPGGKPQRMVEPAVPEDRVYEDVPDDIVRGWTHALTTGHTMKRTGLNYDMIVGDRIVQAGTPSGIFYGFLDRIGLVQIRES